MRIIIVDDIFTNRLLIAEIVKTMGHTILEAENGRKALDMLKNEGKFDLVLMDIEMPVMNGIETTKYIRESMPYPINRIPVVALTAHNPNLFFDDFQDAGFNELLTKPYSLEKLKKLIREFEQIP
jgi:two-component system, response regulator, stage 0 sporulation protein F